MLAVAVSARAPTADPRIEVTLSPRLRTPPLPGTPAGVADRWRNIGSCRKTSLQNALQVEKMLRIARSGAENNALPSSLLDSRTSPMALRLVEPLDRRASKPRRSPIRGRNRAPSGPERAFLALSDACESHRCFVPGPILQGFPGGPEASRGGPASGADCVFVGGSRTLGALAALILSARRCRRTEASWSWGAVDSSGRKTRNRTSLVLPQSFVDDGPTGWIP
jgi:hypothetical protein